MKKAYFLTGLMAAAIVVVIACAARQTPRAAKRKTQANYATAGTRPIQTSSITNASKSSERPSHKLGGRARLSERAAAAANVSRRRDEDIAPYRPQRFMVQMRAPKRMEATHESIHAPGGAELPPGPEITDAQQRVPARSRGSTRSGSSLIVQLERRDKIILIEAGTNGPVYLVKTKDGRVLVQNLSDRQLQAYDPELYRFIKTAVAGGSSKDGRYLDAGGLDFRR